MPSFIVTEQEQESLYGIPYAAQVLYHALRARMDFNTGRVGAIYAISWQALREALYIEPHSGVRFDYPHKESVRRLAGWLERRGLVRFQSNPASGRLIFLLPKASIFSLAQKQADRNPTGVSDREADRVLHRGKERQADREADRGKRAQADTHLLSVPSTTTTTAISTLPGLETLQWPPSATAEEKATWKTLIHRAKLNGDAQLILDELAGALSKGAIQKRTGYLRALIARAKAGDFVPDLAHQVADARERVNQATARTSQARQTHRTNPAALAAGQAVLDNLRKRRKHGIR